MVGLQKLTMFCSSWVDLQKLRTVLVDFILSRGEYVKGLINLWEKIQNGPCITTDRYPPLRHNPYQRQPEQLRRPHTLGYSSASGHLDGSWLPSAAVLRASKTIVVTIVVSLPSTGLK
jgi:hypothetical protein